MVDTTDDDKTGGRGTDDGATMPDGGTERSHGGGGTSGGSPGPGQQYCNSCGALISADAEICPECGVRHQDKAGEEPSSRWKAAIIGGVVSFFIGGFPFVGPVAGGAIAGYMRGSDTTESAITGTLANVLASIPLVLLGGLFLFLGVIGAASSPGGSGDAALGLVVWLFIFLFGFVYFWGLGAVGGAIGASMSDKRAPE